MPHHLVCVEKFTLPYLRRGAPRAERAPKKILRVEAGPNATSVSGSRIGISVVLAQKCVWFLPMHIIFAWAKTVAYVAYHTYHGI